MRRSLSALYLNSASAAPVRSGTRRSLWLPTAIGLLLMIVGSAHPALALDPCLTLGLTLNRDTVEAGEDVEADVLVANACSARPVDVYVVLILPPTAAQIIGCAPGVLPLVFVANGGSAFAVRCESDSVATFPTYWADVTVAAGTNVTVHDVLSLTWPAAAPPGIYTLAIVATSPGAFQDGILDPTDIVAIGTDSLTH
jgi:hypothetical protein